MSSCRSGVIVPSCMTGCFTEMGIGVVVLYTDKKAADKTT